MYVLPIDDNDFIDTMLAFQRNNKHGFTREGLEKLVEHIENLDEELTLFEPGLIENRFAELTVREFVFNWDEAEDVQDMYEKFCDWQEDRDQQLMPTNVYNYIDSGEADLKLLAYFIVRHCSEDFETDEGPYRAILLVDDTDHILVEYGNNLY
jgi:hypothetical protein